MTAMITVTAVINAADVARDEVSLAFAYRAPPAKRTAQTHTRIARRSRFARPLLGSSTVDFGRQMSTWASRAAVPIQWHLRGMCRLRREVTSRAFSRPKGRQDRRNRRYRQERRRELSAYVRSGRH
jgi:hypothetical protein